MFFHQRRNSNPDGHNQNPCDFLFVSEVKIFGQINKGPHHVTSAEIGSCIPIAFRPQPRNRTRLKLFSSVRMGVVPSGRGRAGSSSPVGTPLTPGYMHDSRILAVGWCLLIAFRPHPRNRLGLKLLSSCRMREAPPGRGRAGPSSPVGHPHPPSIDARSTLSLVLLAQLVAPCSGWLSQIASPDQP